MPIAEALQLVILLVNTIRSAIFRGQTDIDISDLGSEHRAALKALQERLGQDADSSEKS